MEPQVTETFAVEENVWSWNEQAHPMTVNTMLGCVTELATAVQRLPIATAQSDESAAVLLLQTAVRQMSVPIRKLCLEGGTTLLQRVIQNPVFLPAGGEKGTYSRATMKWKSQRHEYVLGYENGTRQEVVVPESEHEIEIGRLYGIEFQEDGWCAIKSPFEGTGRGVGIDRWLSTKILQVNSVGYTVRDALKLVADFEGAHTSDQLPAFVAVGVKPDDMDKGARKRYRMANCVYFGCLSYIQVVVIYSGLYIIRMMQELIQKKVPFQGVSAITGVSELIGSVKTELSARGRMANGCHEMIVVGKSNVPGRERRQPTYRMWSGCDDWDKSIREGQS